MTFSSLFIPSAIYTCQNLLVFAVFTYDKLGAKMRWGRISENVLLLIAAIGPVGALTAMTVFRHKTRHVKFIIVPVFLILHVFLVVWLWFQVAG
jgi:uncharacterized membrane protein YsdA (DUF1294 family)